MESLVNLSEAQLQARKNFAAWWHACGISIVPPSVVTPSRAFYAANTSMLEGIQWLVQKGQLRRASARNHGVAIVQGYREEVPYCSAQLVHHKGALIEMDFDFNNPSYDLFRAVKHLFGEVLRRRETDPFKVAQMLRKRGVDVQLIKGS